MTTDIQSESASAPETPVSEPLQKASAQFLGSNDPEKLEKITHFGAGAAATAGLGLVTDANAGKSASPRFLGETTLFTEDAPLAEITHPDSPRARYDLARLFEELQPLPESFGQDYAAAARFLIQAQDSANPSDVNEVMKLGYSNWLEHEITKRYYTEEFGEDFPLFKEFLAKRKNKNLRKKLNTVNAIHHSRARFRTKCAWVMSQHLVANFAPFKGISGKHEGYHRRAYWDILNRYAFEDFKSLLARTSKSPFMAGFLDLIPQVFDKDELSTIEQAETELDALETRPTENYAREVMELFTLGPIMLNDDGSPKLDQNGHEIPSYSEQDIVNIGQALTGWKLKDPEDPTQPIIPDPAKHDTSQVTFLGTTLAAGHTAEQAFDALMDTLVNHPNCAPFVCLNLIRKFVKSNPSSQYVQDIVQVFRASNRNLAEVYKAILLHNEARNPEIGDARKTGKVKEFFSAYTQIIRFTKRTGHIERDGLSMGPEFKSAPPWIQKPLRSETVFNFFSANYAPNKGPIATHNARNPDQVVGPEFEMADEAGLLGFYKFIMDKGLPHRPEDLDYLGDIRHAATLERIPQLVRALNVYLTGGQIPRSIEKEIIESAIIAEDLRMNIQHKGGVKHKRFNVALALVIMSPYFLFSV